MKRILFVVFVFFGIQSFSQKYTNTDQKAVVKEWKGNTFTSDKTFFNNIEEAKELTYIVGMLQDEEFKAFLESQEMITIFTPLDQSLSDLPEQKRDSILNFDNGSILRSMFKFHIVPGRIDRHSIEKAIEVNQGTAYFATLAGERLGVKKIKGDLVLFDSMNNSAIIRESDFYHSKGLFHIVEGMVFPGRY